MIKNIIKFYKSFTNNQKRNYIKDKYKFIFEHFDLNWYQYLELRKKMKKELLEIID